ncbi:hypothetical protein Tco_1215544 [Tanacetum coccineum]
MQQDGRGSVISHFRRLLADQLASVEGDPHPQVTITADPFPTRVPLRPLQLKSSQSLGLVQDPTRMELEGPAQQAIQAHLILVQEVPQHSESRTLDARDLRRRLRSRRSHSISGSPKRNPSVFSRVRRDRSESPKHRPEGRRDGGVFNRLGGKGKSVSAHSESRYHSHHSRRMHPAPKRRYHKGTSSRDTKAFSESKDSRGGQWKSRWKKAKSSIEEDELSQPWICKETDPFTPRIRYFELPKKSQMPNNVKTYDGSDDPEDHLKKFQATAKVERWAMPTWCHMFNSTLTGYARVAASNQARKKGPPAWKQQEMGRKQNFDKIGDFRNQQRLERRHDKFIPLTKSPKEILALDKGKFKAPPPMTTPVEKRNSNKFCEFHGEVGHNTDECMHLKRQIEELIKNGKLSHMIKELKQGSEKDQPKTTKKGKTSGKDKPLAILMVQPWQRVATQKITQFLPQPGDLVPTLRGGR